MTDNNLFDLLGEEGEQYKRVEERSPENRITDKARELIDAHNAKYPEDKDADKRVDIAKIRGSGKNSTITVNDANSEILKKTRPAYTPPASAQAKPEPDVYDKDRVVFYAGHRIEVPTREMKLEEVRAMLEEQFPELTKERSELVYDDKQGHIVPVLKGHRKGSRGHIEGSGGEYSPRRVTYEELPTFIPVYRDYHPHLDALPVYRILGRDGVFEVRKTQTGTFIARLPSERDIKEGFVLDIPKIPTAVLGGVVHGFQATPRQEQLANICYDRNDGNYFLEWPVQQGSATTVDADSFHETGDIFVVMQIHSHGTLPAFWSAQDDADEIRTGLYGVVGRCDQEVPELMVRYSCGGNYRSVYPGDVFEGGWRRYVEPNANAERVRFER